MISTGYFALGFIVYAIFTITTFEVYSKKKEITKVFALWMIYIYYSLLAAYLINFVDSQSNILERLIQIAIYWIACGMYVSYYYNSNIKKNDESYNASL